MLIAREMNGIGLIDVSDCAGSSGLWPATGIGVGGRGVIRTPGSLFATNQLLAVSLASFCTISGGSWSPGRPAPEFR